MTNAAVFGIIMIIGIAVSVFRPHGVPLSHYRGSTPVSLWEFRMKRGKQNEAVGLGRKQYCQSRLLRH